MTTITAGKWEIDSSHSSVTFSVRHLMVSKVRGSFGALTGVITTNSEIAHSSVTANVDASTVSTNDENRDAHLQSEDFFDVANHPELTFVSTKIEYVKEDHLNLTGDLTIRGVTKPVTFKVEIGGVTKDPYGNVKAAAEASTKISRSEFGLTWNSALESGGVLVSDEVTIDVDLQASLVV